MSEHCEGETIAKRVAATGSNQENITVHLQELTSSNILKNLALSKPDSREVKSKHIDRMDYYLGDH